MLCIRLEQRRMPDAQCIMWMCTVNGEGEVWDQDRSRPPSYGPTALAFSAKLSVGVSRRGGRRISLNHPVAPAVTRFALTRSSAPQKNVTSTTRPLHVPSLIPNRICAASWPRWVITP